MQDSADEFAISKILHQLLLIIFTKEQVCKSMPEYSAEEQNFHLGDSSTLLGNRISNPFQALQLALQDAVMGTMACKR